MGGHFVPDIKVDIPHREQIFIKMEDYLRSRDLHRAINSGIVFKLDTVTVRQPVESAVDIERMAQLELENARLKEALERANKVNSDLHSGMANLQQQMTNVLSALGRIEAAPTTTIVQQVSGPGGYVPASQNTGPVSEAVGGEAPMFLPDLSQDLGEARIQITEQVSDGDVSGPASKLRQLRGGGKKK